MKIIAKNERIHLRQITKADAPFIFNLLNQKGWLKYIGDRKIKSLKDAQAFIKLGPRRSYKSHGFGHYLVVNNSDNAPVGVCGFMKRAYMTAPDLGFAISEEFYQKGYGFSAASLAMSLTTSNAHTNILYAMAQRNNIGSCALLEKLGFVLTTPSKEEIESEALNDLLLYKIENMAKLA